MSRILSLILGGINQTLGMTANILNGVASLIQIYEFLFSKVEPQVSGMYQWTYNTAKNLEALVKEFNELNNTNIKLNKETAPEVQTRADRWVESFKEEAEKLKKEADEHAKETSEIILRNKEIEFGIYKDASVKAMEDLGKAEESKTESQKLKYNFLKESVFIPIKEHVVDPVVESVKKGYDYVKEKFGGFLEEHPTFQPYFYGKYKDYKDVPGMTDATKLSPGLMASKMTPEAYADLIVGAIPEAVKRAEVEKAKTPGKAGEKVVEEAGLTETQKIAPDLQELLKTLPASVAALQEIVNGLPALIAAMPGRFRGTNAPFTNEPFLSPARR